MLLFTTFLVGVVGNGLYLWVLGLKMRTVTILWFLHLVSCYLLFTLLIPFFTIYILLGFHWVFSMAMCKLLYAYLSLGMFTSLLLTLITLDFDTLIHNPVWFRNHYTLPQAGKLVVGVWLASFALSAPYLAFWETHMVDGGRIICTNNYNISGDWNGAKMQDLGRWVHLAIFMDGSCWLPAALLHHHGMLRLRGAEEEGEEAGMGWEPPESHGGHGGFLLPRLVPYHLYHSLKLYKKEVPESVTGALMVIYTLSSCFSASFSSILYLFMGEKFCHDFTLSLLTLVKAVFVEDLSSSAPESNGRQGSEVENTKQEMA
ncbi:unnamed protein product [Eretmochelys imbricata]